MDNLPENKSNFHAGGGLPVIQYWVEKTLSPQGLQLWQTLNHKEFDVFSDFDARQIDYERVFELEPAEKVEAYVEDFSL